MQFWRMLLGYAIFQVIQVSGFSKVSSQSVLEATIPLYGQCPASSSYSPNSRVSELDGESLERALDALRYSGSYVAVLYYASWCPFSMPLRLLFDDLSAMFPGIHHIAVAESALMPIVLSKHGVHSFPTIILRNVATRVRYSGPKDISSIINFYHETTGIAPVNWQPPSKEGLSRCPFKTRDVSKAEYLKHPFPMPAKQLIHEEPYLVGAVIFLLFRITVNLFPKLLLLAKRCWSRQGWHIHSSLLSECTPPLLKHALHIVNLNKLWSKFKFSKRGNFQGAKNARVWASLASVSLGKGPVNRAGSSNEAS